MEGTLFSDTFSSTSTQDPRFTGQASGLGVTYNTLQQQLEGPLKVENDKGRMKKRYVVLESGHVKNYKSQVG